MEKIKGWVPEGVRNKMREVKDGIVGRREEERGEVGVVDGGGGGEGQILVGEMGKEEGVAVPVGVGIDIHGIEEAERENKGENASMFLFFLLPTFPSHLPGFPPSISFLTKPHTLSFPLKPSIDD